ncbi:MAG: twin-arginine translocase TatA/TatE family subunit [Planctomycetes bacterium]|nr:twin-arginine translocase TatA/TatE family subunit [Planctomycetota bacterium]
MLTLGFLENIGMTELIVILVIVLLLFGHRLPGLGRNLGKSVGEFKQGLKEGHEESTTGAAPAAPPATPATPAAPAAQTTEKKT